jgi:hypothetical protein
MGVAPLAVNPPIAATALFLLVVVAGSNEPGTGHTSLLPPGNLLLNSTTANRLEVSLRAYMYADALAFE